MESCHNKLDHLIIEHIKNSHRDRRAYNTQQDTFDDEWCPYKEVSCPDQFHDTNLFLPHRNTHGNGIADQEECNCQQYKYN